MFTEKINLVKINDSYGIESKILLFGIIPIRTTYLEKTINYNFWWDKKSKYFCGCLMDLETAKERFKLINPKIEKYNETN